MRDLGGHFGWAVSGVWWCGTIALSELLLFLWQTAMKSLISRYNFHAIEEQASHKGYLGQTEHVHMEWHPSREGKCDYSRRKVTVARVILVFFFT